MRERMNFRCLMMSGAMLFWFLAVQLVFGIYMMTELFSRSEGEEIISFYEQLLHMLLLFLPVLISFVIVIQRGIGHSFISGLRSMTRRIRCGYLCYILVLLFLHFNFTEGYLYMEGRWMGPSVWLDQSMTSYVVMAFCHLVFAEFSSVLYLAAIPLLCYAVKAEKGAPLCGVLS